MESSLPQSPRKIVEIEVEKLEKASIIYDNSTDTLHINLSEEEADEVILLENGVIVRIKGGILIGLSIQGISRFG